MSTPVSIRFRLPGVAARLRSEAAAGNRSTSSLAEELIDEGLRMRRHPMVTFRDGPSGRRPGLVGGPDIWEVAGAIVDGDVPAEQRVERAAEHLGLRVRSASAALDYYAEFAEEIDREIARNREASEEAEAVWRSTQRILAG